MSDKLIIYYSRSGENYSNGDIVNLEVGNCEIVAKYIQEITNADIFKVETLKDYPLDYMETTEVAKKELNDNYRPELKKELDNIDAYSTVYIVSPNWWGTLPMAMFTQLEKLNFDSVNVKTIITHEGSALGESMKDISKLCKNANIFNGLAIHGSEVEQSLNKVKEYVNKQE